MLLTAAAVKAMTVDIANLAKAYHVTPARLLESRQYLFGGLFWGTAAEIWVFAALAWLAFSGGSARLRRLAGGSHSAVWRPDRQSAGQPDVEAAAVANYHSPSGEIALYTWAFITFVTLVSLPFELYLGFFRERAYGFQHQSIAGWFADWGKSYAVSAVLTIVAVEIAYAVIRRFPRRWWVWAWAVSVVFVIFSLAIDPVFIEPLFNQFTPIHDQSLRSQILAMAHRSGIPASNVYEVDRSRQSGHTNAYVVGLLGTQRIVIYDTLLETENPQEIEFVVGHEIGHYVLHHIWKGIGFTAALLFAFYFLVQVLYGRLTKRYRARLQFSAVADIAGLPLLLLILALLLFIAAPLENGFSRWEEHQADAYGLRICPAPLAAITGFEKDVNTDLIYPNPPRWIEWWFFTHPSNAHRIEFAEQYCRARGIAVPNDIAVP